jgi:hypothetical protein
MPHDDEMTIDERLKYLRRMRSRYLQADRKERGHLLDDMQHMTGLARKTLIRRLHGDLTRHPWQGKRTRTYGSRVEDAVRVIAESCDYITSARLAPNLDWLARHLAAHGELELTPGVLAQLGQISVSTLGRILQHVPRDRPRLPRQGPEQANHLRHDVPMRRIPWDEGEPGHFEADLVHHCGPTTCGEYVHTVQLLDVATAWSERVAVLGRSYLVMEDAFARILLRLPFPILEIHPDNGSEFFNQHLLRFWAERVQGMTLSRSRPWQKNDNRFVEQKNDTLVRAYLGHERLDTVAQTQATNVLYEQMWLYYNFFQPVMRLAEKSMVPDAQGTTHIRRRFDQARTPFDRLCATGILPRQQQEDLERLRDRTNPRQLRESIYDQISILFSLPCAVPGIGEDVYATLATPVLA